MGGGRKGEGLDINDKTILPFSNATQQNTKALGIQYLHNERVAAAVLGPQVLWGSQTAKLAVDHYSQSSAEGLALLHAVRCQDDRAAAVHNCGDLIPEKASGFGVHARRRLIKEDDWRIAKQGDGNAELALVATAVATGLAISPRVQLHVTQSPGYYTRNILFGNATQPCKHRQCLTSSQ